MEALFYAAGTSILVTLLCAPALLPVLRRLKFGQSIREEGPKSHQKKSGTPTMGGVIIIVAIVLSTLLFDSLNIEVATALFLTLGHGLIGFLDDFIKVVMKRNLGLRAKQKFFCQIAMACALTYILTEYLGAATDVWIPFINHTVVLNPVLYYILIFFVLVGTTNAVNLTDGLDGLAAGTVAVASLTYAVICMMFGKLELAIFCMAVAGAAIGFLKFNLHPAKVFMGDTGSLALGGALAAVAVLTKTELLLVIVGGVFVMETLSVILQVASYKTTGRRIFKMSPIHHHFELSGWSETKVVVTFWLTGVFCSALALVVLVGR